MTILNTPFEHYRRSRVINTWWPLAASWVLMAAEGPALSAVVARLANPEISLAAYGGVVFPLSLIIESPIIMLLAASTALSKDWASYRKVWRFMMATSAVMTLIHILVAFTPLYYLVVEGLLEAPEAIVEPARVGLMIMTPWTWSIAYRRFNQGVLIRFGHSRTVGIGTVIRLAANAVVLSIGYLLGTVPGIMVAASAVASGVISEAIYAGIAVRPVLNKELKVAKPVDPPLTFSSFLAFYIPLALTSLLTLLVNPIVSAAVNRMPNALDSQAAWQVTIGLTFLLRSLGVAYNEVVVALLDEPGSYLSLRWFTIALSTATTLALTIITVTPLSKIWFESIMGIVPALSNLAEKGLWMALPMPALSVLQSWYQGTILFSKRTRGITESVGVFLAVITVLLLAGVWWGKSTGLYIGLAASSLSMIAQTVWLWFRSQPVMQSLKSRDSALHA